ncbi:MAG: oligosaccharide flippase family protein [Bacteroidia bacterium]|nr:oligosaccharide flippase family protein [Bacteroidia bacterium]
MNLSYLLGNYKDAGYYFLGTMVQVCFSFLVQPVYSSYLSAEDFGILGFFDSLKGLLLPIFIFGMPQVFLMKYYNNSAQENRVIFKNMIFFYFFGSLVLSAIVFPACYSYFDLTAVGIPFLPYIVFMLLSIIFDNIKMMILLHYRIEKKSSKYFLFSVVFTAFNFALGLLFVAEFEWGILGRFAAPLVTNLLMLPICLIAIKQWTAGQIDYQIILRLFKYAIPLVLSGVAFVILPNMDRIFLETENDLNELGLYSLAITITNMFNLGISSLQNAFEPDIFKAANSREGGAILRIFGYTFIPSIIGMGIFIIFSSEIIGYLTSQRYLGAVKYANLLIVGVLIMSIFYFFDKTILALQNRRASLFNNLAGAALGLLVYYFFISRYHFLGAALAKIFIGVFMSIFSGLIVYLQLSHR